MLLSIIFNIFNNILITLLIDVTTLIILLLGYWFALECLYKLHIHKAELQIRLSRVAHATKIVRHSKCYAELLRFYFLF